MTTKVAVKPTDKDALPAQPLNKVKFLEVMRDQLKTADGKTGITFIINNKEYLDETGDKTDEDLQKSIFLRVRDGDERAIVRRFFANLDE